MTCIFCKIVAGDIPSYKIYEDENVLAFLDITPINPGHTLVIPKKHFKNLEEIDEDNLDLLMRAVKKVGLILKNKLGILGYNVIENNDSVAGQIIPHIHFHIIPRNSDDNLEHWAQGKYKDGEAEDIIKKIKL